MAAENVCPCVAMNKSLLLCGSRLNLPLFGNEQSMGGNENVCLCVAILKEGRLDRGLKPFGELEIVCHATTG